MRLRALAGLRLRRRRGWLGGGAAATLLRRAVPAALHRDRVRHRVRVWHELVCWFRRLRVRGAFLGWACFWLLSRACFWRRRRPFVDDDDRLDGVAGLAPDLLAELLRVELPADDHLVGLVLELNLLDAVILSEALQDILDLRPAAAALQVYRNHQYTHLVSPLNSQV